MICRIPISYITANCYRGKILDIESVSDCLKDEPDIYIKLSAKNILTPNDIYSASIDNEYLYVETEIDIYDYLYENEYFSIHIIGRYNATNDDICINTISRINIYINKKDKEV